MSNAKPSWIDYANLASNLAQNVQLGEVCSALNTLGALQAEKVRLELSEQQRMEREDRLREGLWQMENAFNKLTRDTVVAPCALCVMTRSVQLGLERFGVTSAMFSQLADKDRLGSFQERLQEVVAETLSKLSAEQRADVESFFRFSVELEELRFLLARHAQTVKRDEAERQWVDAATKLRRILESLIPQKLAGRMKALEQTMVSNDEEATRIFNGPEWDEDGGDDKWDDAIDRRDEAAASLRQAIYEACEKLRQHAASQPKKEGILSSVFNGSFRLSSPFKPVSPETFQEIDSLERIMRESVDLANSPSGAGGERGTELAEKHGRDAESWKKKIAEREAFMRRFSQSTGISPDDLLRYSADTIGSKSNREMSPEVQALARRADQKISAIILYQKQTGASLAEAKAAVEAFAMEHRE